MRPEIEAVSRRNTTKIDPQEGGGGSSLVKGNPPPLHPSCHTKPCQTPVLCVLQAHRIQFRNMLFVVIKLYELFSSKKALLYERLQQSETYVHTGTISNINL